MKKPISNQIGIIHPVLLVLGLLGLLALILFTTSNDIKSKIFTELLNTPITRAAEPGILFLDQNNQPVTQSTTNTVKVQLTPPWNTTTASRNIFNIIPEAFAQTQNLVVEAEYSAPNPNTQVFNDPLASMKRALLFKSNVTLSGPLSLKNPSNLVTIRARGDLCMGNPVLKFVIDGNVILEKEISQTSWTDFPVAVNLGSGTHQLNMTYSNDYVLKSGIETVCDRNLRIDKATFQFGTTPSPTPVPTPTPTPVPTIKSAVIAQDPQFLVNPLTINPFVNNPTVLDYTFTDGTGLKTLYAKFISSTGEERVFTNQITIVPLATPTPTPTPTPGFTKGVAIIGDSHSDEYRADSSRGGTYGATTFNWMEVLAQKRTIDFGPWGSWGGARRNGYKYNWALSGMTTSGLISYNVGAGIAGQVTAGEVGYVLIQIGTDDFAPQLNSFFNDIYNGTISGAALESRLDTMAGRVSSTIDTIKAAGDVKIVLSTAIEADIPRVPMPDAEKQAYLLAYPDPVKRQRVLDAMIGYNQRLRSLAQTRSIPVFEGSEYFLTTVPGRFDANGFFNVGGELIDGKTRGNEPHHLLIDDTWFHPGTVASGQFANAMFIGMFNQNFQTNLAPLTDQEILQAAGINTP